MSELVMKSTPSPPPVPPGFMPAEWAPHDACWMGWPCRTELWGNRIEKARREYAQVALAIAQFEPVIMIVPAEHEADARKHCAGIEIRVLKIDDSWLRDSGPCFTLTPSGALAGTAWRFNAWGKKFAKFTNDAAVGAEILRQTDAAIYESELVAEGGAFTVDGEGTLITTESCLLNHNRNPGWSRAEIESELRRGLGVQKIIWLPGDPEETGTDGHVDGLAAFTAPGRVMVEVPTGPADPRYRVLQENRRALELARDARGRSFELLPIFEAHEKEPEGNSYCRSYINFYVANGGVVVPQYGVPGDAGALEAVRQGFPGRKVVGTDVTAISYGGGGIHCITQQQPTPQSR